MPYAQVYFNDKEFEEINIYLITKKKGKWSKQKLLKKSVLKFIREDIVIKPR